MKCVSVQLPQLRHLHRNRMYCHRGRLVFHIHRVDRMPNGKTKTNIFQLKISQKQTQGNMNNKIEVMMTNCCDWMGKKNELKTSLFTIPGKLANFGSAIFSINTNSKKPLEITNK